MATGSTALPASSDTDVTWYRVTASSGTISVKRIVNPGGTPTDSDWSSTSYCFNSTAFTNAGGMLGFWPTGVGYIDDLIVKSKNGSSFSTTELEDHFTVDSTGYALDTLTYDNNGNLLYDGTQAYTYDAWNRLVTVAHAYRDSGGTLHSGQISTVIGYIDGSGVAHGTGYDALGRRIIKSVNGTGNMDCTYNYFLNGQSVIEETTADVTIPIRTNVWGLQYIDELIQTSLNTDPDDGDEPSDVNYWACQDANYNVLGLVDSSGILTERYEYSAYGTRQVFASAGSNDPGCYAPASASTRFYDVDYSHTEPWGLCEFGHQGLMHDEESGLIYNRERMINATLGRFLQEDPEGYVDGINLYSSYADNSINNVDPTGLNIPKTEILATLTSLDTYHSHMEIHVKVGEDIIKPCNCDEIKFKQYYTQVTTGHLFSWTTSRTEDKVGSDGYYIYEDPWVRGSTEEAFLRDSPGQDANLAGFGWHPNLYLKQDFDTQVVCSKGKDKGKVYLTVFWGHSFMWYGSPWTVTRQILGKPEKTGSVSDPKVNILMRWTLSL